MKSQLQINILRHQAVLKLLIHIAPTLKMYCMRSASSSLGHCQSLKPMNTRASAQLHHIKHCTIALSLCFSHYLWHKREQKSITIEGSGCKSPASWWEAKERHLIGFVEVTSKVWFTKKRYVQYNQNEIKSYVFRDRAAIICKLSPHTVPDHTPQEQISKQK